MIIVGIILIIIAFFSLFFDTGYLENPRFLPIILDIILFALSLIILFRSIVLYKIGEKEMLSKKVRELEAKVDFLTKKEEERMKFGKSKSIGDSTIIEKEEEGV